MVTATVQGVLPWSNAAQTARLFRPAPPYPGEHAARSAARPSPRRWGFACELLTAYKDDAGMTTRDLARASGLGASMVARIAVGYQEPTAAQVRALADALGVDDWALCWA